MEYRETENITNWALAGLFAILHIIIAILCIIIYSKIDTAINALSSNANELTIFNVTIMLAAISNFISASAVIIREYKRQKSKKLLNDIQVDLSECCDVIEHLNNKLAKLSDIKCTKCGKTYPQGTKFCNDCGTNLLNQTKKDGK